VVTRMKTPASRSIPQKLAQAPDRTRTTSLSPISPISSTPWGRTGSTLRGQASIFSSPKAANIGSWRGPKWRMASSPSERTNLPIQARLGDSPHLACSRVTLEKQTTAYPVCSLRLVSAQLRVASASRWGHRQQGPSPMPR
jgi:hypothetical protein